MAESKLTDIIGTSLEKIKEFADSETVVGEPINAGGITIIPVSKISMGFASGGIDYNGKNKNVKEMPNAKAGNFGGGGGTGVNITPIAFLVISATGSVEILPITQHENNSVEKITSLIERSPDILQRLKNVFAKNNNESEKSDESK